MHNNSQISTDMLSKAQQIMFEMLCEVDRVFRENNIRYCLAYGTLLGAIRHQGFIPWDDDVDIHVFSEDYDEALKALNRELNSREYVLHNKETDPNYWITYTKLRHLKSQIISLEDDKQEAFKYKGLHVDLFRAARVKSNSVIIYACLLTVLHAREYNRYRRDFFSKVKLLVCILSAPVIRILLSTLKLIPGNYVMVLKNFPWIDFGWGKNNHHVFLESELYPFCEVEIDKRKFYAPKDFDRILSSVYGDYMQLPPVEKRRIHFSDILFTDHES